MPDFTDSSCRICLQAYRDDFECIFDSNEPSTDLSPLGCMYETLFALKIHPEPNQPRYLCNYCSLQLELFHNFKGRAVESYAKFVKQASKNEELTVVVTTEQLNNEHDQSEATQELEQETTQIVANVEQFQEDQPELIETIEVETLEDDGDIEEVAKIEKLESDDEEFMDIQYLEDVTEEGETITIKTECEVEDYGETTVGRKPRLGYEYACKTCNEVFSKKSEMILHRKITHRREKLQCNQCPKKFISEEYLEAHLKMHLGLPAFQCDMCGKTFKQKVHHTTHMNTHLNKREVRCEICDKGFITKGDLKMHYRMHTDERRYECEICLKKFRMFTHLKNHRFSHFGKTIDCPYCSQKYTSPPTLKQHIRSVHQNLSPYSCSVCNKKFKRSHHLEAHKKTHTPKTENIAPETITDAVQSS